MELMSVKSSERTSVIVYLPFVALNNQRRTFKKFEMKKNEIVKAESHSLLGRGFRGKGEGDDTGHGFYSFYCDNRS